MGPILFGLIKLQSVENRLRAAKAKLARCRRNVIIQENQVRTLQNALETKKEESQLTKVQSDRLELELRTRDEHIAKCRASLNAARTNKEYAAILTQLNTTKADNSKIEAQILELMRDIEADESECEQIKNQIAELRQKLEQHRKDAEIIAAKLEVEIQQIQEEWDTVARTIPQKPLEIFKRVAETYDGEAIAVINQPDARTETFSCGGCFMGIIAENVNLLMTMDDVIRCPNCTRILVLTDSTSQSASAF